MSNLPATDKVDALTEQLAAVQEKLDNLSTQLLHQKLRRRRLTIRFLLLLFVLFGGLFAWFSWNYRISVRQAKSADKLIDVGAFLQYEPRQSLLLSMLPGDPAKPPKYLTRILGEDFFRSVSNVSTRQAGFSGKKKSTLEAVAGMSDLQRLRLNGMTLQTNDLEIMAYLPELESLDVSRTTLDAGRIPWLSKTRLRWLDMSHTQIGDSALVDIANCGELQSLNLERTAISDVGLRRLGVLKKLRSLNLNRAPVSIEAVRQLAKELPECRITWQPLKFRGSYRQVDVAAARSGAVVLGKVRQYDPRKSQQPIPPSDNIRFGPQTYGWPVYDGTSAPSYINRSELRW